MKNVSACCGSVNQRPARANCEIAAVALVIAFAAPQVHAFDIDTGNSDFKARWDNTFKYSAAWRLEGPSSTLVADINQDDGDRNFGKGLISNRLDLLSEFDASYGKHVGLRVSGAAWYDEVYRQSNDNNSPATINQVSAPHNEFTSATRNLNGQKIEVLDGFAYVNYDRGNVRLGRHTLLYGETLFFGANGIAYAQAPLDLIKLLTVPSSQFKEVALPVDQISGQVQLTNDLSLGAYYQLEFRSTRIPAVGSYLSAADVLGDGTERFLFAPGFGPRRIGDLSAKNSGQGGLQLRWRHSSVEYGIYAVRYNDKLFQFYLRPAGATVPSLPFNIQFAYPEGITSYGASFSTEVAGFNVAGEASVRHNTPLVSGPVIDPLGVGDNNNNPLYAVGNSAHANLSGIFFLNRSAIWDNANVVAEVAWNRRLSISKNPAALDPDTTRDAWGFRFVFEPTWFQVAPSLDLSAPIGLGYNPLGKSSVVQQFNGGVDKGGDFSIGLKAVYQQVWKGSLTYTTFLGPEGTALNSAGHLSFKQPYADRNFISISLQRTL
jgi:hypothetical protein